MMYVFLCVFNVLFLFYCHFQRIAVLASHKVGFLNLAHGNVVRVDAHYCVAAFVYAQHQGISFCFAFALHLAQHVHHKIHCSEVVVVHFHPVHIGFLNPNLAPFAHFFVGFCHWL